MKNDIPSGQQKMDSITQSPPLHVGGFVPNWGLISSVCEVPFHKPRTTQNSYDVAVHFGPDSLKVEYPPCEIPANDPEWVKQNQGYPDNNPKTAVGAKKLPLELVPPSAVAALAEAFADGAKKYGPYNWREKSISSSIYYGAALRHLSAWWDGEDLAEDSGIHHLYHALACIAMLVDGSSVGKLNDNRPPKGAAGKMQQEWLENHK